MLLYSDLPKLTGKITESRLNLAGHCYHHPELVAHKLTLWTPVEVEAGEHTPMSTLLHDTGTENVNEPSSLMADRVLWKKLSRIRVPRDPVLVE